MCSTINAPYEKANLAILRGTKCGVNEQWKSVLAALSEEDLNEAKQKHTELKDAISVPEKDGSHNALTKRRMQEKKTIKVSSTESPEGLMLADSTER